MQRIVRLLPFDLEGRLSVLAIRWLEWGFTSLDQALAVDVGRG